MQSNVAAGRTPTLLMQSSENTREHRERAARVVAANATDRADARALLEMLGLVEPVKTKQVAPTPKPTPAVAEPLKFEWIDTPSGRFRKCRGTCGRPVRLRSEPAVPGVLVDHSRGMCARCHRAPDPNCRGCGREFRPSGEPAEDYPGTVKHTARSYCATCYERAERRGEFKPKPKVKRYG